MSEAEVLRARSDWQLLAALVLGLLILLPALAALVWTPYGGAIEAALAEPSPAHWLGTDAVGRDLLSTLMSATVSGLLLATFATVVCLLIGIPVGMLIALRFDADAALPPALAMPVVALALGMLVVAVGAPAHLTVIVAIIGPGLPIAARLVAGAVHPAIRRDFATAARLAGLSLAQTMQRHVLPRLLPRLVAIALQLIAAALLVDFGLSVFGIGTLQSGGSLGLMLRDGVQFFAVRPLLVIAPLLVVATQILALLTIAWRLNHAAH